MNKLTMNKKVAHGYHKLPFPCHIGIVRLASSLTYEEKRFGAWLRGIGGQM